MAASPSESHPEDQEGVEEDLWRLQVLPLGCREVLRLVRSKARYFQAAVERLQVVLEIQTALPALVCVPNRADARSGQEIRQMGVEGCEGCS